MYLHFRSKFMAIRTRIIQIGNSQGIRIPKSLLEQTGLEGDVELAVKDNSIIIQPLHDARAGWEEAFKTMSEHGDDSLLIDDASTSGWDEEEWTWD